MGSDEEDFGESRNKRPKSGAKPKHWQTKYCKKLEKEYPWMEPCKSDETKGQCKLCPKSASTGNSASFRCERSYIVRHASTEKHLASAKSVKFGNSTSMQSFLAGAKSKSLNEKVKYAEIKLGGYVAAHDEPFLKMDHLVDVLKDIFPDSEIAQNISCKRTKTKGVVVNVIGKDEKEYLRSRLKDVKFSIMTDESTDISCVKTSCIMVRFYDEFVGKIVSRFWDLQQVFSENDPEGAAEGATARRLFELIKKSFDDEGVPFANVIGFGSDGCNVMMGCNNSVSTKMKELCPGIRVCKCLCHSLHICASEACKCLPRACEDLARYIYSFFNSSAKRRSQFVEFLVFLELDVLKILHPSQTRWLSLCSVVKRILEQWEALRLFFDAKWVSERLESAERIHILLNDPIIKCFYLFLQWILPKITGMNEYFQSEKSVAAFVHEKMISSFREILCSYMKRDFICRTAVNDIRPDDTSKWLDLNQIYLGVGVMTQLGRPELKSKPDLVKEFLSKCRNYLVTLCSQIKLRYDFADPVLQRLRCLAPEAALSQKEREATPTLLTLAMLLPRIVDRSNEAVLQKLDDQWRSLPFAALPSETTETKDIEDFWHKLYVYQNEIGERPFSTLAQFSLEALSLPIANADCERMFSKINNIKVKKRNRLLTKTICGVLHADASVRRSTGCCAAFKPRKSMFDKMTSSMYNFADDDDTENAFSAIWEQEEPDN